MQSILMKLGVEGLAVGIIIMLSGKVYQDMPPPRSNFA